MTTQKMKTERAQSQLERPLASSSAVSRRTLATRYREIRAFTKQLCDPLKIEDYVIQSMPDTSPAKWHLAHTSWFFETFVLENGLPGHRADPHYAYLFNSYYNAAGPMHCRPKRGLISRPTVEEIYCYREQIDERMTQFFETATEPQWQKFEPIIELGLHHEQQHQELLLMDIKHVFAQNPLGLVYQPRKIVQHSEIPPLRWIHFSEGVYEIGNDGTEFCFDNETPRHRVFLEPFQLASRLVTNGDYLAFIEDGGYERSELWLSLGWFVVNEQKWNAPLYWEKHGDDWFSFTLSGLRLIERNEPVCHASYFEADAFARWAKARLPTEQEWEIASAKLPLAGNFVDEKNFHPIPLESDLRDGLAQMFGDVWEWTRSSYSPYPGYAAPNGALGEYNGKFMCNQYVLRGGSCVTAQSHIRRTYRNFFAPEKRWPFTGIRLARDVL